MRAPGRTTDGPMRETERLVWLPVVCWGGGGGQRVMNWFDRLLGPRDAVSRLCIASPPPHSTAALLSPLLLHIPYSYQALLVRSSPPSPPTPSAAPSPSFISSLLYQGLLSVLPPFPSFSLHLPLPLPSLFFFYFSSLTLSCLHLALFHSSITFFSPLLSCTTFLSQSFLPYTTCFLSYPFFSTLLSFIMHFLVLYSNSIVCLLYS